MLCKQHLCTAQPNRLRPTVSACLLVGTDHQKQPTVNSGKYVGNSGRFQGRTSASGKAGRAVLTQARGKRRRQRGTGRDRRRLRAYRLEVVCIFMIILYFQHANALVEGAFRLFAGRPRLACAGLPWPTIQHAAQTFLSISRASLKITKLFSTPLACCRHSYKASLHTSPHPGSFPVTSSI